MAEVVVFHSVHGLTPGVRAFAGTLGDAGHTVHAPDLFDGRVFADLASGSAHAREIGFDTVVARGRRAVDGLPGGCVYAGFSLGVLPAQALAQTRPGARGALLYSGCVPATAFADRWPADVPVQVHGMAGDEVFAGEGDLDAARTLVSCAADGELYLYAGTAHLFADPGLPGYDPDAARMLTARTLGFLERVG
ncbi:MULTISPECIES: dienelactone hydrolase family protein [unclassified Blastococcus]